MLNTISNYGLETKGFFANHNDPHFKASQED
jgi:hypothetical protein